MYSALWIYFWQQFLAKFSIMSLYYRLFRVNQKFCLCNYGIIIYHIGLIIVVSVMLIAHCQPLGKFWNPLLPGRCIEDTTFVAVTESINSSSDFLLVPLAIGMVRILQISRVNRWRPRILFGSGALVGIIGFVKVDLSSDRTWLSHDETSLCEFTTRSPLCFVPLPCFINRLTISQDIFTMAATWSNIQAAVCIVCCCAPMYKSILPGPDFWGRFTSKLSSSYLRRDRYLSHRSNTSPSIRNTDRREPSRERRERGLLGRDDDSSLGLIWTENSERVSNEGGAHGAMYPL